MVTINETYSDTHCERFDSVHQALVHFGFQLVDTYSTCPGVGEDYTRQDVRATLNHCPSHTTLWGDCGDGCEDGCCVTDESVTLTLYGDAGYAYFVIGSVIATEEFDIMLKDFLAGKGVTPYVAYDIVF